MTGNDIIIYQTQDGKTKIDVRIENETVWLTIDQMAKLFDKSRSTINEHILNAYKEGELQEDLTKRKIGNSDFSTKPTNYYNLDVIISVGYRVKSLRGTQFRIWATQTLKAKKNIRNYSFTHNSNFKIIILYNFITFCTISFGAKETVRKENMCVYFVPKYTMHEFLLQTFGLLQATPADCTK